MTALTSNQKHFIKLMKMKSTQELIAFGLTSKVNQEFYTIRDAITNPSVEAAAECEEVFGTDFGTICQALIALNIDLDQKFYPVL
jgi:hypothetical protein